MNKQPIIVDEEKEAELDRREVEFFATEHGWHPPEGADIKRWLEDMREKDDNLQAGPARRK